MPMLLMLLAKPGKKSSRIDRGKANLYPGLIFINNKKCELRQKNTTH
jgi:hypothetical protein